MPIGIDELATTVVASFLIPYVKKGAEKIAEEVTNKFSQGAANQAADLVQKVWNKVKSLFTSDKEKNTLQYFEGDPDTFQAAVEKILQQKLKQDSQAARELDDLINAPNPTGGSTGAQIMNATYAGIADLRGANLSSAKKLTIGGNIIGQPQPNPQGDSESEKKS